MRITPGGLAKNCQASRVERKFQIFMFSVVIITATGCVSFFEKCRYLSSTGSEKHVLITICATFVNTLLFFRN
jgi:hypothetical protein